MALFYDSGMGKESIAIRFGVRLRSLRLASGVSQEGFADLCGLHRTYVGAIERGEKVITIETGDKLARALGVSLDVLFKDL